MEKIRKQIWFTKECLLNCESGMKFDNSRFLNEFLENAVSYYSIYLLSKNNSDFVTQIFMNVLDAKLDQTETRLSKLMFKQAVEQAKTSHLLAYLSEVDDDTLKGLHLRCINDVKKTNGKISFEDTYKFQKGLE